MTPINSHWLIKGRFVSFPWEDDYQNEMRKNSTSLSMATSPSLLPIITGCNVYCYSPCVHRTLLLWFCFSPTVYSFVLLCLYCCTTLVHCVSLLPSLNMVLRVFRKGFVIDKRICVNVCVCVLYRCDYRNSSIIVATIKIHLQVFHCFISVI